MIYDFLVDLLRHLSLSLDFLKPYATFIGVFILLLRQNNIKKMVNSHLPKKFRDTQSNDIYDMKKDIRAIKKHLGVVECGDTETSSNTEVRNYRRLSLLLQMVKNQKNRRRKRMKAYLKKLTSRKFQSFVVGFITQIFILLKLDVAPYVDAIAAGGLVITTIVYIWAESSVDKVKGAKPDDQLNIPIEPTL